MKKTKPKKVTKASFEISKIDDIDLKKYNITLKNYKKRVSSIIDTMLNIKELRSSKIFRENISKIRFAISFCNNSTIREINRDYRAKDTITDVITFSLFCDDENALVYRKMADLGEIIISIERADEQKKATLEEEILILITHGIMHLFGFDHLNKKDYDFVVGIQDKVIKEIRINE